MDEPDDHDDDLEDDEGLPEKKYQTQGQEQKLPS